VFTRPDKCAVLAGRAGVSGVSAGWSGLMGRPAPFEVSGPSSAAHQDFAQMSSPLHLRTLYRIRQRISLPVTCVSEGRDMPGILLEIVIGAVTAVLAAMLIDIARTINGRSASRRTARH